MTFTFFLSNQTKGSIQLKQSNMRISCFNGQKQFGAKGVIVGWSSSVFCVFACVRLGIKSCEFGSYSKSIIKPCKLKFTGICAEMQLLNNRALRPIHLCFYRSQI